MAARAKPERPCCASAARPRVTVAAGCGAQRPGTVAICAWTTSIAGSSSRDRRRRPPPVLLLIADEASAATLWRPGSVLVRGPELVRSAVVSGDTVTLRGDTRGPSRSSCGRPPRVARVVWNGRPITVRRTRSGSLLAVARSARSRSRRAARLLTMWRYAPSRPRRARASTMRAGRCADHTHTNSTTPPPRGQPVLTADDYGFHHGDVWYRGRFTGAASGVTLRYGGRWLRTAPGLARRPLPGPERAPGRRDPGAARRRCGAGDPRQRELHRVTPARGATCSRSWSATTATTRTGSCATPRKRDAG